MRVVFSKVNPNVNLTNWQSIHPFDSRKTSVHSDLPYRFKLSDFYRAHGENCAIGEPTQDPKRGLTAWVQSNEMIFLPFLFKWYENRVKKKLL